MLTINAQFNTEKLIGFLFFSTAFMVWVSFGLNSMDSQPWVLLSALLFLTMHKSIIKVYGLYLLLPFVFSIAVLPLSIDKQVYYSFRGISTYATFSLAALAFYCYFFKNGYPIKTLLLWNLVFILVGIAQSVFGDRIFEAIVGVRTTEDRGVTSLTPEPTYFGMCLVFFSWFYLYFILKSQIPKNFYYIILINILSVIFLAKSAMALMFIVLLVIIYFYKIFGFLRCVFWGGGLTILSIMLLMGFDGFEGFRIYKIIDMFLTVGPISLVLSDASINYRVSHVVISLISSFDNAFIPFGFGSFDKMFLLYKVELSNYFWYGGGTNSIMSFMGAFVFELGIFGFIFLLLYVCMSFVKSKGFRLDIIFLFFVMNSALSVAFPFLAMIFALFWLDNDRQKVSGNGW